MGKIFSFKDTSVDIKESEEKNLRDLKEAVKYKEKESGSKPTIIVQFSWELLALILLVLAVIFMGNQLFTVVIFLFLGFVFMSATKPIVNWLVRKKFSRGWAVALTYFLAVVVFIGLSSAVLAPFVSQATELVNVFPQWINDITSNFKGITIGNINIDTQTVNNFITEVVKMFPAVDSVKNVAGAVSSVFSTTTLLVSAIIFSIYLVLEHDSLLEIGLIRVTADEKRERIKKLVVDVERKLGSWLLGQATVSMIAGIYAGIVLTILDVPFALPLAVLIALLDSVPSIGATIAMIPVALVTLFTLGPVYMVIVLVCLIIYQQVENNYIVPKIMGNAIGLKPVIVMLGVVTFLTLFGIGGALVAVPIIVIVQIIYEFYIDLQKLKAKGIV